MAEVRRRRDELWAELEGPLQEGVEESIMVLRAALRSTWSTKERIAAARVLMAVAARGLCPRT